MIILWVWVAAAQSLCSHKHPSTLCLCLQLEETQTKRHDQLVEQHNELLQEIQDQKPKVKKKKCLFSGYDP